MSTSTKHTLRFIEPVLLIGNRPPPSSTSRPPAVIHVIGIPRPSCFLHSSASVYYPEHKPKNKKRGRPGNEATQDTLGFHGNCQNFTATINMRVSTVCTCNRTFDKHQSCSSYKEWFPDRKSIRKMAPLPEDLAQAAPPKQWLN